MSSFSSTVQKAYRKKWSYINNFTCMITPIGSVVSAQANRFAVVWRDLDLNIKDVTIPQFSFNPIEIWLVDMYRHTNGQTAPMTLTVTFRDENQMHLYKSFIGMFEASKSAYPDDAAFSVQVFKDADYLGEIDKAFVFDGKKALINSVSQLNFSNETEAQIAEFSVEFFVYEYTIHA